MPYDWIREWHEEARRLNDHKRRVGDCQLLDQDTEEKAETQDDQAFEGRWAGQVDSSLAKRRVD